MPYSVLKRWRPGQELTTYVNHYDPQEARRLANALVEGTLWEGTRFEDDPLNKLPFYEAMVVDSNSGKTIYRVKSQDPRTTVPTLAIWGPTYGFTKEGKAIVVEPPYTYIETEKIILDPKTYAKLRAVSGRLYPEAYEKLRTEQRLSGAVRTSLPIDIDAEIKMSIPAKLKQAVIKELRTATLKQAIGILKGAIRFAVEGDLNEAVAQISMALAFAGAAYKKDPDLAVKIIAAAMGILQKIAQRAHD